MKLIDKSAVLAEIDKVMAEEMKFYETACKEGDEEVSSSPMVYTRLQILRSYIDTLEVKEVDLIIHTIIAECCDWLAMNTNLSHDEIEGCRNLMLTVKDEQLKAQKGEKV